MCHWHFCCSITQSFFAGALNIFVIDCICLSSYQVERPGSSNFVVDFPKQNMVSYLFETFWYSPPFHATLLKSFFAKTCNIYVIAWGIPCSRFCKLVFLCRTWCHVCFKRLSVHLICSRDGIEPYFYLYESQTLHNTLHNITNTYKLKSWLPKWWLHEPSGKLLHKLQSYKLLFMSVLERELVSSQPGVQEGERRTRCAKAF